MTLPTSLENGSGRKFISLSLLSSKQIKFRNEDITYLSMIHIDYDFEDFQFKSIKKAAPSDNQPTLFYSSRLFRPLAIHI